MSNFTPLVTKKFEFDGDTVTVRFSRIKRKHFFKLMPLFMKFKGKIKDEEPAEGEVKKARELNEEELGHFQALMNDLGDSMLSYIKQVEGLNDAAGEPVSKQDMMEDSYFLNLQIDILMSMIDASLGPMGKKRSS